MSFILEALNMKLLIGRYFVYALLSPMNELMQEDIVSVRKNGQWPSLAIN